MSKIWLIDGKYEIQTYKALDGLYFALVFFTILGGLHVVWTVLAGLCGLDRGY